MWNLLSGLILFRLHEPMGAGSQGHYGSGIASRAGRKANAP